MFSNLLAHPNRPNVAKNKFNMPHKSLHDKGKLSERELLFATGAFYPVLTLIRNSFAIKLTNCYCYKQQAL
jgi:hypothetical protein